MKQHFSRSALVTVFWLYLTLLFLTITWGGQWGTPAELLRAGLYHLHAMDTVNLRPFHTIHIFLKWGSPKMIFINIWGNIALFFPFGLLLPLLWRHFRSPLPLLVLPVLLSGSIEIMQLFISRQPDVDDVLLNALGSDLGAAVCFLLLRRFPQLEQFGRN